MGRGFLRNLTAGAGVVAILALMVAVLNSIGPALPSHAVLMAVVVALLLLIQACVPWPHCGWTNPPRSQNLVRYGTTIAIINNAVFFAMFALAACVLTSAYIWQSAPAWIEQGLDEAIRTNRLTPIAASSEATPFSNAKLPEIAVAEVAPASPPTAPATAPAQSLSLYPVGTALTAAIGSTRDFSHDAYFGVLVQVMVIIAMVFCEPLADKKM